MKTPNYNKIYRDLIETKFPENNEEYKEILQKKLTTIDVMKLNDRLFYESSCETLQFNQQHRFYDKYAVLEIIDYQKKNNLNNTQVAKHFKMSRNTIAKWKKIYLLK